VRNVRSLDRILFQINELLSDFHLREKIDNIRLDRDALKRNREFTPIRLCRNTKQSETLVWLSSPSGRCRGWEMILMTVGTTVIGR